MNREDGVAGFVRLSGYEAVREDRNQLGSLVDGAPHNGAAVDLGHWFRSPGVQPKITVLDIENDAFERRLEAGGQSVIRIVAPVRKGAAYWQCELENLPKIGREHEAESPFDLVELSIGETGLAAVSA